MLIFLLNTKYLILYTITLDIFFLLVYTPKAKNALVAQWIEHLASDQGVVGSTPAERAESYKHINI